MFLDLWMLIAIGKNNNKNGVEKILWTLVGLYKLPKFIYGM